MCQAWKMGGKHNLWPDKTYSFLTVGGWYGKWRMERWPWFWEKRTTMKRDTRETMDAQRRLSLFFSRPHVLGVTATRQRRLPAHRDWDTSKEYPIVPRYWHFRAYWVPRSSKILLFIYSILVNRNRGRVPRSSCPDPLLQLAIVTALDKVCQTVKVEAAAAVTWTRGRDNSVTELRDLMVWDWWSKPALSGATLHLIISEIVINFLITGVGRMCATVHVCGSEDSSQESDLIPHLRGRLSLPVSAVLCSG